MAKTNCFHGASNNCYPLFLIAGFSGWGRDELGKFNYWGGFNDIEQLLNDKGFQTYTPALGPVSSNWDRACELFAIIKGGQVDYGSAHARKHGHQRYGRSYPGLYPEWGELNPHTGERNKIHIIGHSMGGQTARLLVQLLHNGRPEEQKQTPSEELSTLFDNHKKPWVHSVTTISSPHNGSTLTAGITGVMPHAQHITAVVSALIGGMRHAFYDFKLDQWDLKKAQQESFRDYTNRIYKSGIWKFTKDLCSWDLSPEGASELNSWVKAQPEVYYFSWATKNTFTAPYSCYEIPRSSMNPLFMPFSLQMGAYKRKAGHERLEIDERWWPNDGIVNTYSMDGPKLNSTDEIIGYTGKPVKGKWNYMGLLEPYDHMNIVGMRCPEILGWYVALADLLCSLHV
ncbi:lipase [Aneurinibacillus sp. Ricciae_BoGa-3]|uniref:esterase/lipase family protein n=1 Tax=Aneurinibacillus sp. Ricciae_BoGa-3 TaxID=3022697 RepID=UPI0023426851|nr:lipase [Aneurinibacillus sp. Ricciae_BoGa-3]WCK55562.1 lipase [Aneurinibacillus sp. Ricciae_BoGa-3]